MAQLVPKSKHPLDLPKVAGETTYLPEIDYAARGFQPLGQPPEKHFCERCVLYYQFLGEKGIVEPDKNGNWPIRCYGDRAKLQDQIDPKALAGMDDEAQKLALISLDPVTWARTFLHWEPRWYQAEVLRCSSQYKVARWGRRAGKTESMTIDIWHAAITKDGRGPGEKFDILIVCPFEAQVKKIFEDLERFKDRSEILTQSVSRARKDPYEIELFNGTIIRGFPIGGKAKGGARSAKVRGQGANRLYFDEIDYMSDDDIETMMAVQADNADVRVWASSTPTGQRGKYWSFCVDKSLAYKEFHFISAESPAWEPHIEKQFRAVFSEGGYNREFYAEFGQPSEGVFRQSDLDNCIREYGYDAGNPDTGKALSRRQDCKYVMGVDWNKATGTHIVILEGGVVEGRTFYRVVDKQVIRRSDFTQTDGVKAVMRLDAKWDCEFIYADMGYGDMQTETMWLWDKLNPAAQKKYRERFIPVHGNQTIELPDFRGSPDPVKKPAKPMMVELVAYWVQQGVLIMSDLEDTNTPLLEEEVAFLNIGLIQQMRNFRVEKYSPTGQPRYSQGYEHTLMALCLASLGMCLQFSELRHKVSAQPIRHHSGLFDDRVDKKPDPGAPTLPDWMTAKRETAADRLKPSRSLGYTQVGLPGYYNKSSAGRISGGGSVGPANRGLPSPTRRNLPPPTRRIP